jgi:hypothetical protein
MRILKLAEYAQIRARVYDVHDRVEQVTNAWENLHDDDGSDEECYEQSFCDLEDEARALRDEADTLLKTVLEIKRAANG